MSRLAFHRPARLLPPRLPDEKIVLPAPPEAQRSTGASFISTVLPLLSSVGMAGYMVTYGKPLLVIVGILFVGVSIGTAVMMRVQMRNASQQANRKQRTRYRAHLHSARDQAREVSVMQRLRSAVVFPEPQRLWGIATTYERVWERRPADSDFLQIRVGTGRADLATPLQIGGRLDPMAEYDWEALSTAQRLVERMGHIDDQPAVVDLGKCGVVSVLGPAQQPTAVVRAMLCQVAVLHAPDDVGIVVETSGGDWTWAKWLPHAIEPRAASEAGAVSLVAAGPDDLADFLEKELLQRQELVAVRRGQMAVDRNSSLPVQRLIVVFTGFDPVSEWGRSALLRALVEAAGPRIGMTLVFLSEREADEPSRVDLRIRLGESGEFDLEGQASLVTATVEDGVPDQVSAQLAELIARRLAPLRLSDESEQVLARAISLTHLLLGGTPTTDDIVNRWAHVTEERLLRVPIGNDGDGEPVILDIKESAQGGSGPHGLIVGATGSGKSELLRTLLTGLSITHSPELISFVLVDFKGGAAFAPFLELPHVAGLITNLADDAAMIDRVQAALRGEQQRRQRLLRDAGNVDSIREYQRRQRSGMTAPDGKPLEPLPYLLIVVDEFGELLAGRPEFTELFVQIGRVGRSLGMHLLLATQRLEEGKLRGLDSHLSYRICLRTFSAGESRTVIGTPDAYRLPPIPGSAYLKVDESIFQRFRAAHVSAPYRSPEEVARAGEAPLSIVPFDLRRRPDASAAAEVRPAEGTTGPTELAVVVDQLKVVGRPVHQVWLAPLPPAITMDSLLGAADVRSGRGFTARTWPNLGQLKVPIGVTDLPHQQAQEPLVMDFGGPHGHLALVGAPQTGRSTSLRSVMAAGMLTHTPDEMQFYCIDFGGGTLHQFAAAPHVGTVAGRRDHQLVRRMLAEIQLLIEEREVQFRELGVDSIAEFRARRLAGRLPEGLRAADVFLMVDNWGAIRTELEEADARVADIAARGLGVGVHLVLTASRWIEIRPALRDSIGTRVELRLNDPLESEVNRRMASQMGKAVPGRGLVSPGVFFQLLLPRMDGQDTTDGIGEAQDDLIAKISAGWTGPSAPEVRMLPTRLTAEQLGELSAYPVDGVPVGIAEADLRPVGIDLTKDDSHLVIFGDAGAGKTQFLRRWLTGLSELHSAWDVRVVLIDYRRALLGVVSDSHLGAYAGDAATASVYIEQVCTKLRERLPPPDVTPRQLRARDWWQGPDIYVVIDDYDLLGGGLQSPLAPLVEFVPHAREVGLHVVVARRVTGSSRSSIADQLLVRLKEMGCAGLVLSGDRREGAVIGEERAEIRPPGRGVLVRRGHPGALIQIALEEEAGEYTASATART